MYIYKYICMCHVIAMGFVCLFLNHNLTNKAVNFPPKIRIDLYPNLHLSFYLIIKTLILQTLLRVFNITNHTNYFKAAFTKHKFCKVSTVLLCSWIPFRHP